MYLCYPRIKHALDELKDRGYPKEVKQRVTKDSKDCLELMEGEVLSIKFGANIQSAENSDLKLVFNSNRVKSLPFTVKIKDKYAQMAREQYYGFVRVLRRTIIKTTESLDADEEIEVADDEARSRIMLKEDYEIVCEMEVYIPKVINKGRRKCNEYFKYLTVNLIIDMKGFLTFLR